MAMKKTERKEAYVKVINALIAGENEKAYDEMRSLTCDDLGLFVLCSYENARKGYEERQASK